MATVTRRIQISAVSIALIVVFSQPVVVQFAFGTAMNLGPVINRGPAGNQPGFDGGPNTSSDGLTLYFVSDRPGGEGGSDLWAAQRATAIAPWSRPVNLGSNVNGRDMDASPSVSADGLELYFDSSRPGGQGEWDLWVTNRASLSSPWESPHNLGPPVNSAAGDGTPHLAADGLTLYFNSWRAGGFGKNDIWVTTRRSREESWQPPVNLGSTVNTADLEWGPAPSPDGLTLFFQSDRPGGLGGDDLYATTRATLTSAWTPPENLRSLNSPQDDAKPHLSADESTLYFMSTRLGGYGLFFDVWAAPVQNRPRADPR